MMPWVRWLNENSGFLTLVFSAIVAIATVFYVILTSRLVRETAALRRLQSEPQLDLTLQSVPASIHVLRLVLRNVGMGPAMGLQILVTPLTGGEVASQIIEGFGKVGLMKRGLSYLGPRQEVQSGYVSTFQLGQAIWDCSFEVVINYQGPERTPRQERWIIDFAEQKGNYTIGTPPLEKIEKHLEQISKDLHNALTGWNRPEVDIFTAEDRRLEEVDKHRQRKANERQLREGGL